MTGASLEVRTYSRPPLKASSEAETQARLAPFSAHAPEQRPLEVAAAGGPTTLGVSSTHRIGGRWTLLPGALRVAAVVVPVGVVLLATSAFNLETIFVATIAVMLWVVALRRSYANAQVSRMVQGNGVASAVGVLTGLAGFSLLGFWLPGVDPDAEQILLMTVGVFVTSASVELLAKRFELRHRVLLVRTSGGGADIRGDLAAHPHLPFDCVGVVADDTVAGEPGGCARGTMSELAEIVTRTQPDLIVLGDGPGRAVALGHLLDVVTADCRIVGLDQFYEYAFGRVPVEHLSPVWFMSVLHLYQRSQSRIAKRLFDLAGALVGLAVVTPLMLVLAMLVRRSSQGPVIFRQIRLGEGGKTFEILKFRTMVDRAERDGAPVWATDNDPRETRVGSFMRSTRLDELPQFWNVVRGEMSLVGPRPERPEFVRVLRHEVPFWTARHLVKPGITGWAQVRLGCTTDNRGAAEKLSYDLYYLRHRSVLIDLAILVKTARVVLHGIAVHHRHRSVVPVAGEALAPARDNVPV